VAREEEREEVAREPTQRRRVQGVDEGLLDHRGTIAGSVARLND